MTWADAYLICFIVGFALSAISVFTGLFDLHIPGLDHHGHVHFGHFGDMHGHGHAHTEHRFPHSTSQRSPRFLRGSAALVSC
jgi:hypothetical protein